MHASMTMNNMTELNTTGDTESDARSPSVWLYIISVSLSILLIVALSNFVFNLVPERSEFLGTEIVANETFKKYSQRLEAITEKYAKEIEVTKTEI